MKQSKTEKARQKTEHSLKPDYVLDEFDVPEISLCEHCWCMTHTNSVGFCCKCGADKTKIKPKQTKYL